VAQVFVDGNSFQRYLVAVLVPDEPRLKQIAQSIGVAEENLAALCSNDKILQACLQELNGVARKLGLMSLELVRGLHLSPDPFTIENGLLTPTMKLKRPQLRKHFRAAIDQLYKELEKQ